MFSRDKRYFIDYVKTREYIFKEELNAWQSIEERRNQAFSIMDIVQIKVKNEKIMVTAVEYKGDPIGKNKNFKVTDENKITLNDPEFLEKLKSLKTD